MSHRGLSLVLVLSVIASAGLAIDLDGDGLDTTREVRAGTAVLVPDTDGDGLADGEEVRRSLDPRSTDSDADGLADRAEVDAGTDALVADTDRDGLADGREVDLGLDPNAPDSDDDGLDDANELDRGTDPLVADTDGDGLDDGREDSIGSDPHAADTDDDSLGDAREVELGTDPTMTDTDGDGIDDDRELSGETDPTAADTDDDGLDDGRELALSGDPNDPDTDADGLLDGREVERGTDLLDRDTDDDGFADGLEVTRADVLPDADPLQRDVYVEVDAVDDASLPNEEAERVVEAFAAAPVGQEGARGIALHVVYNETGLEERGPMSITGRPGFDGETVSIRAYMEDHYDYDGYGYHYLLVVPEVQDVAGFEVLGEAEEGELLVQSVERADVRGTTFMHELGHSLGLDRDDFDGIDSRRYEADEYRSVMNYNSPTAFYGFSGGEPFDDWAAIESSFFAPEADRLDEAADG